MFPVVPNAPAALLACWFWCPPPVAEADLQRFPGRDAAFARWRAVDAEYKALVSRQQHPLSERDRARADAAREALLPTWHAWTYLDDAWIAAGWTNQWDWVTQAMGPARPDPDRRRPEACLRHLEWLRDTIGPHAYYAGVMP